MRKVLFILWFGALCAAVGSNNGLRRQRFVDAQSNVESTTEYLTTLSEEIEGRNEFETPPVFTEDEVARMVQKFEEVFDDARKLARWGSLGPQADEIYIDPATSQYRHPFGTPAVTDPIELERAVRNSMNYLLWTYMGPPTPEDYEDSFESTTVTFNVDGSSTTTEHPVTESSEKNSKQRRHKHSMQDNTEPFVFTRGIPGVNFPDYEDIPETSFTCSDKDYVPGFYADLAAGCQVFHACWPERRETFLCPKGTIFNQALLACDLWYRSNCSLAPYYFDVNEESYLLKAERYEDPATSSTGTPVGSFLGSLMARAEISSFISHFIPVKSKVTVYPASTGESFVSASVGEETESMQFNLQELSETGHGSDNSETPLSDEPAPSMFTGMDEELRISTSVLNEALERLLTEIKEDGTIARFYKKATYSVNLFREVVWMNETPEVYVVSPESEKYAYYLSINNLPDLFVDVMRPALSHLAKYMDKCRITNEDNLYKIDNLRDLSRIVQSVRDPSTKVSGLPPPLARVPDRSSCTDSAIGKDFEAEDKILQAIYHNALENVLNEVRRDSSLSHLYGRVEFVVKMNKRMLWGYTPPEDYVPAPGSKWYDYYLSRKSILISLPSVAKAGIKYFLALVRYDRTGAVPADARPGMTRMIRSFAKSPVKPKVQHSRKGKRSATPHVERTPVGAEPIEELSPPNVRQNVSEKTKQLLLGSYMRFLNMQMGSS